MPFYRVPITREVTQSTHIIIEADCSADAANKAIAAAKDVTATKELDIYFETDDPVAIVDVYKADDNGITEASGKKLICRHCHSDQVLADAYIAWDVKNQDWDIVNEFENISICESEICQGGDSQVKWVPIFY